MGNPCYTPQRLENCCPQGRSMFSKKGELNQVLLSGAFSVVASVHWILGCILTFGVTDDVFIAHDGLSWWWQWRDCNCALNIEPWAVFSPLVSLMMSPSLTTDFHDDDDDMRRHLSKYLFASGPVFTLHKIFLVFENILSTRSHFYSAKYLWPWKAKQTLTENCSNGKNAQIMNKFSFSPYNESFIDQACSVKIAGHWPWEFFVFLLTLTLSQSMKTQKKNLANIQPLTSHLVTNTYVTG